MSISRHTVEERIRAKHPTQYIYIYIYVYEGGDMAHIVLVHMSNRYSGNSVVSNDKHRGTFGYQGAPKRVARKPKEFQMAPEVNQRVQT